MIIPAIEIQRKLKSLFQFWPSYLLIVLGLLLFQATFAQKNYYLSPSGNDQTGDGSNSMPFKTIGKVMSVIRNFSFPPGQEQDIVVNFKDGEYFLSNTIAFGSADSGKGGKKIIYKSINPNSVTITSALTIPNNLWSLESSGLYKANLTGLYTLNDGIRQIYIGNTKGIRARYTTALTPISNDVFEAGALPSTISRPHDIEIVQNYKWILNRLKVMQVDIASNQITVDPAYGTKPFGYDYDVWWLENAKEFINQSNEWYFDKSTKILYVKSASSPMNVVVPTLTSFIKGDGVSNIRFEGLQFSYATWLKPNRADYLFNETFLTKQGSIFVINQQHWTPIPDVILFEHSSNIEFVSNKFSQLGADALSFQTGSKNVLIDNNQFQDIGAGAIEVGAGMGYINCQDPNWSVTPSMADITENITVTNNYIQNVANEYFGSVGIFLTFGRNINISSNTILDLPYSGISTGYCWDTTPTLLGNVTISNNDISNVLAPVVSNHSMSDGAGIYNLGSHSPSSSVANNQINGIPSHDYPKVALYFDQGSNNMTVSDNGGSGNPNNNNVFLNYNQPCDGKDLVFENNNFTNCADHWAATPQDEWAKVKVNGVSETIYHIASDSDGDMGVRFVDVDHNGLEDMIYFRWLSSTNIQRAVYLNTGYGFTNRIESGPYLPPYHIITQPFGDMKVEFVDFDNDGYKDMLYCRKGYADQCRAYRNTGNGWEYKPNYNPPKPHFDDVKGDLGVRYVDVNQDHLPDVVYFRWINASTQERGVYLNTGNGWTPSGDTKYFLPYHITADGIGDLGVRFVDLNNDGFEDFLFWRWDYQQKGAYLNTLNGWQFVSNYVPPYPISSDAIGDLGVRFVDIDHDGLKDLIYHRITSTGTEKGIYLNKNNTWQQSNNCDYSVPIPISNDNIDDLGVRFIDLNNDGYEDLIKSLWVSNSSSVTSVVYMNGSKNFYCIPEGGRSHSFVDYEVPPETPDDNHQTIVYPVPTSDFIKIKVSEYNPDALVTVRIKDSAGKTLFLDSKQLQNAIMDIDVSTLPIGMYLIEISTHKKNTVHKFVKIN